MPPMNTCGECGGKLRRVHRTFWERFRYLAVYRCRECDRRIPVPWHYTYRFGGASRCPKCGTFRVVNLKARDKIDPMYPGVWNRLQRLGGGSLRHCRFCRVQFYDRRPLDTGARDPVTAPREAQGGFRGEPLRTQVTPDDIARARDEARSGE